MKAVQIPVESPCEYWWLCRSIDKQTSIKNMINKVTESLLM
jgi:hypothetical protein